MDDDDVDDYFDDNNAAVVEIIDLTKPQTRPASNFQTSPAAVDLTAQQSPSFHQNVVGINDDDDDASVQVLADRLLAEELQRQEQQQKQLHNHHYIPQQFNHDNNRTGAIRWHRGPRRRRRRWQESDRGLHNDLLFSAAANAGRNYFRNSIVSSVFSADFDVMPSAADNDSLSYEQMLELSDRIGKVTRGATQSQINSLPTVIVTAVKNSSSGVASWTNDEGDQKCPICLEQYQVGEERILLPVCMHGFHRNCANNWLQQSKLCPVCRVNCFFDGIS